MDLTLHGHSAFLGQLHRGSSGLIDLQLIKCKHAKVASATLLASQRIRTASPKLSKKHNYLQCCALRHPQNRQKSACFGNFWKFLGSVEGSKIVFEKPNLVRNYGNLQFCALPNPQNKPKSRSYGSPKWSTIKNICSFTLSGICKIDRKKPLYVGNFGGFWEAQNGHNWKICIFGFSGVCRIGRTV